MPPLQLYFLLSCIFRVTVTQELIQANLIWRHGDRSSRHTYPNDPYKHIWKDGSMQLTEAGKAREYDLGIFLRSKYGHLLSEKYREGEVYIQSTDIDRTLMSAQCVAAGLYSPKNVTKWNGIYSPWQSFPVHSEDTANDWLYQINQDPIKGCPEFDTLKKKIRVSSSWYANTEREYREFFNSMTNYTGAETPYTVDNIGMLYDNLFCLRSTGYKLPSWADDKVMNTLIYLAGFLQGLEYTDYEMQYTKTLSKMRAGIVLANMIENMEKRIRSETNFTIVGYSAHDSSVGPLLTSMGAFNWIVPPYASCVILDLYRNKDGGYFVEFWYRNDSNHDPYPLSFYECGQKCDFDKFKEVAASVVTDDSTPKLCGIEENKSCSDYAIPVGILISILGFTCVVAVCSCAARKRKSIERRDIEYRPLSLNDANGDINL